ncbi:MAG: calcineurin-like phosphoesterase C-terminal domain-containing protein [Alistipes sp.]|nr:calcineurin-like phosphoesterase C-terminal domain-containing protein [Alistipes sp.]
MKRILMTFALLLSVIAVYAGGIKNATELVAFATALNKGGDLSAFKNDKGEICLEADIDMAKVKKFIPARTFGGVFNGQGFALKNWKAQSGLFLEILEGGKVCNLRIDASCVMKAQSKGGECFIGWIAGINNGTVENCENHGALNHKSNYTDGNVYVGGLVGSNRYVVYRCRNYGEVNSASISCGRVQNKVVAVYVGGIVGATYPKSKLGATTARCENYGAVKSMNDARYDKVGGILGEAFRTTVKMCINRGNVSSTSTASESGGTNETWAAGIVGYTKGDIICCDNFGTVSSAGVSTAHTAGICGMPHNKLVIADCTNYAKIEAANDVPSFVGGIAATIGREVHIVNGANRGEVSFIGASPLTPSYIGGIVGQIYTTKKAATTAYLRRCVNYGKVESLSGGNNYENHNNAIHTGGIVGQAAGNSKATVRILDCANKGEVKSATGRRGNIAANLINTDVKGGEFSNYAEAVEPMADGSTIYGRVATEQGEPVVGCVVSDGKQCVTTDSNGHYALKSDMNDTRFVFISIPADYEIPFRKSVIQNFYRIPRHQKGAIANFTLAKRTAPTDKYTVIMIGDPQMRGLGIDGSGERYRDVVLPDVEEYKKSTTGEFFAINLGDLVYNWMAGYDDYMDISAPISYPMCHVIGNHDYDQANILEGKLGTPFFEEYISPTYYSFTIGKVHYVMVNSIEYSRENAKKHYKSGLDDEQMKWLEEDLKYIPKDYTIFICGHANLFKKPGTSPNGSYGKYNVNYERYKALLLPYKRIYSWSGHYHTNYGFDYAGKPKYEDMSHISAITAARCIGTLRSNMEMDNSGVPNGYMVVDVDGENFEWWYKSVGHDRSYQMRAYSPVRTGDGYVKVNVWNHTEGYWSDVEWWENGVKVGSFENFAEPDPDYLQIHATKLTHLKGTAAKYAKPGKSRYMFRIKPSEGVRSGEIRVTDNFGKTYTQKVEW